MGRAEGVEGGEPTEVDDFQARVRARMKMHKRLEAAFNFADQHNLKPQRITADCLYSQDSLAAIEAALERAGLTDEFEGSLDRAS